MGRWAPGPTAPWALSPNCRLPRPSGDDGSSTTGPSDDIQPFGAVSGRPRETSMSLLELIERADERALAAGALACLDRCLPLLAEPGPVTDGPAALVRSMLGAAPSDFDAVPLREWADACSLVALRIHGRLDAPDGDTPPDEEHLLKAARSGEPAAVGP